MNSFICIVAFAGLIVGIFGCTTFTVQQCYDKDVDFIADGCNSKCFYTCLMYKGVYTAQKRCCNNCEIWSQDLLTCVNNPANDNCEFTDDLQNTVCDLEVGPTDYTFVNNGTVMECAIGTEFSLVNCTCIQSDTNPLVAGTQITCITFDNGYNNLQGTGGVYVESNGVTVVPNCTTIGGNCGYFNESSMTIPLFSNCLDSNLEFSMAAFFKRDSQVSGLSVLVGNGNCGVDSSFDVISEPNQLSATVRNADDVVATSGVLTVADDVFVHIAVVYDGQTVSTYLDGVLQSLQPIYGKLKRVYHPMVIGNSICTGNDFFTGYMDTISFARVAFSPSQIADLSNNREKCLPTV